MAFKTFVSGAVLTASDVNTYLAKQAVIVCTSGTRPSSPPEGMAIYETDTDKLLVYTTATTGWQPPWNMPWGHVASATTTTVTGTIGSSYKDITGLSVTWTAVANRRYKVSGFVNLASTAQSLHNVRITTGADVKTAESNIGAGADDVRTHNVTEIFTGTAASTTRKLMARVSAGSGATQSDVYGPHLILVEDIGPTGAPA